MRVIYIGTYNTDEILSGPEKVSKRIFEEYSKIDKTLFVDYFHDGRKFGYFKKLFGYEKTADVNGSEVLRLGIFRMLYRIIRIKPDVIHILCFKRFVLFLYLLKIFLRVNIFYTLNGIIRQENKYFNKEPVFTVIKNRITENVIVYFSDRIFYLSEYSKSILYRYYSPDNTKLSKVINGLDDCFLEKGNKDHLSRENNSVIFIGNVEQKEKGFDFLCRSIKNCNAKIKLYIIDSADRIINVKEYANAEVKIVDKMTPVNMIEFLKDKRIVVTPSEHDTFSISTLEAISCGLYPVLTGQTGISEIIGKYTNVSVVNYGDGLKLADVLSDLISSETSNDINTDLKEFSWNNVLQNYYLSYYQNN